VNRHFDAGAEEGEPITFTWKGSVYRCRGSAPALPLLRGMRAYLDGELDREAEAATILELMEAVFEDGELDRILKTGISLGKLQGIVRRVYSIQQGDDGDGEGEAVPPRTGAIRRRGASSNGSISSRRTSRGSTT